MNGTPDHKAPWYFDSVFYCIDLARFRDSSVNGFGDFTGLTEKLDYLQWLGIDVIWLLPFYRSPRHDNGYDITDHYEIDHRLGTTGDFVEFLREAEHRNIKVLIDLVINHTSSDHRWFEESRDSASPKRDWYVWANDDESVPDYPPIFPPLQKTTWSWDDRGGGRYLHHFYDFEPDLNTQNLDFQAEIRNMVEYWIRLGVRGFRVDGAPFFGQKKRPNENAAHELLYDIHEWAKDIHAETVLLPEANLPVKELEPYAHNGDAQMLFDFVTSQHLFLAMATEEACHIEHALGMKPEGGGRFQWINFLRNQDELSLDRLSEEQRQLVLDTFSPDPDTHIFERGSRRRFAPLLGGDHRRMQMAFSLLFAMPGTPMFIAGDEIGMGDNLELHGRDAARLPIQWSAHEPNGGFSEDHPANLVTPVLDEGPFGIEHVNVEDERNDENSILNRVRELIQIRKLANPWMTKTTPAIEVPSSSVLMLTYRRDGVDGEVTIAHNLSPQEVTVELPTGAESAWASDGVRQDGESVTLGPFGYAWWVPEDPGQSEGDTNA